MFISMMYSISIFAQIGTNDIYDSEDSNRMERYAHFGLSTGETVSIVIGIILLLIAKNMTDKSSNLKTGLGCVGIVCAFPLVFVVLAVAQKTIGYASVLVIVGGGLYFLFGKNK